MSRCFRRVVISSFAALSLTVTASAAHAQEPEPAPAAKAAAPAPASARGCTLGAHPGIDDVDAQTSADVVCHELAKRGGDAQGRELRMGRLGGRILLTVASPDGDEKRLMVNSLEEIPTAAPRLAEASSERTSIEATQHVDNVVGEETRTSKVKPGQMGFKGGIIGAMPALGASTGAAPGIALGLLYRAGRFGIDGHLRGGGGGGTTRTLTNLALGIGGQYYFTDGDFSPYAGTGIALLSYKLAHDRDSQSLSNTGLGVYGEVGIEALRSHRTALTIGVRADVPTFELKAKEPTFSDTGPGGTLVADARPQSRYVVPVSLMVGVVFH